MFCDNHSSLNLNRHSDSDHYDDQLEQEPANKECENEQDQMRNDDSNALRMVQSLETQDCCPIDAGADVNIAHSLLSRKSVSFKNVEVREFTQILGDNPACMEGPPLSLSWHCVRHSILGIDEYEADRKESRRKVLTELKSSKYQRRNVLAYCYGISLNEMKKVEGELTRIQKLRVRSARGGAIVRKAQEAWESAKLPRLKSCER